MKNKPLIVLDVECYPNYFLVAIKGLKSGRMLQLSTTTSFTKPQRKQLHTMLTKYTSFGFNSNKYDMPLINYLLDGASVEELYQASKDIVERNQPNWMTYSKLDLEPRPYDHFDISEPAPAVMISLKNYGTRVGSEKLWDLPYDPHKKVSEDEQQVLEDYCENDLDVTIDLYRAIEGRINLRLEMSEQYGLDLRSKSDAQIAETVIASEIKRVSGKNIRKPDVNLDYKPRYSAPSYISFDTKQLDDLVDLVSTLHFDLGANGAVKMPKELSNKKLVIGNTTYKMGIGGLHSQEKSISVVSNATHVMRNADFDSYYPRIILTQKLYPKHIGKEFLKVYDEIVTTRLKAKAEGNKIKAQLKVLYGMLGKKG